MLAQTPQVFRKELLDRAFDNAQRDGFSAPTKRLWWST